MYFDNFKLLNRYWTRFEACTCDSSASQNYFHSCLKYGCGLTAYSTNDALGLLDLRMPDFMSQHQVAEVREFTSFRQLMSWVHSQPEHPYFGMRGTRESDRLDIEQMWRGVLDSVGRWGMTIPPRLWV